MLESAINVKSFLNLLQGSQEAMIPGSSLYIYNRGGHTMQNSTQKNCLYGVLCLVLLSSFGVGYADDPRRKILRTAKKCAIV